MNFGTFSRPPPSKPYAETRPPSPPPSTIPQQTNVPPPPTFEIPPSFHYQNNAPPYNIAQMMEQIRFSIKLEVDARAAIAERQLSAIMTLTKNNSDELDRLRMECSTVDRDIRGLDQNQQKLRQDMTTQKDIMYHVQSMCGKDESWRMQADNQLLELRQLVAALREQGNSIQVSLQEKLSRPELLVHFNACVEPLKAQLNAGIQHQAQIIGDLSRNAATHMFVVESLQKRMKDIDSDVHNIKQDMESFGKRQGLVDVGSSSSMQSRDIQESVQKHCKEYLDDIETKITAMESKSTTGATEQIRSLQSKIQDDVEARLKRMQSDLDVSVKQDVSRISQRIDDQVDPMRTQLTQFLPRLQAVHDDMEKERSERKKIVDTLHDQLTQLKFAAQENLHKSLHELRVEVKGDIDKCIKEGKETCESLMAKEIPFMLQKEALERQKLFSPLQTDMAKFMAQVEKLEARAAQANREIDGCQKDIKDNKANESRGMKKVEDITTQVVGMKKTIDDVVRQVKEMTENDAKSQLKVEKVCQEVVQKQLNHIEKDLNDLKSSLSLLKLSKEEPKLPPTMYPPVSYWPPPMYMNMLPPGMHSPHEMYHPSQSPYPPAADRQIPQAINAIPPATNSLPLTQVQNTKSEIAPKSFNTSVEPAEQLPVMSPPIAANLPTLTTNKPAVDPPSLTSDKPAVNPPPQPNQQVSTDNTQTNLTNEPPSRSPMDSAKPSVVSPIQTCAEFQEATPNEPKLNPPTNDSAIKCQLNSIPGPPATNQPPSAVNISSNRPRASVPPSSVPPPPLPSKLEPPLESKSPAVPVSPPPVNPKPVAATPSVAAKQEMAAPINSQPVPSKTSLPSSESVSKLAVAPQVAAPPQQIPPPTHLQQTKPPPPTSSPSLLQRMASSPASTTPTTPADKLEPKKTGGPPTLLDDPTMKGAMAEAELAKARVENRLKIERERRHTLTGVPSPKDVSKPNQPLEETKQMVKCHLCFQDVALGVKLDHELNLCPMRMQTCSTCSKSFRAKVLPSHLCEKPQLAKCKYCLVEVADMVEHESTCDHALKQCPHCLRRQKACSMSDLQEHINNCDCRLVQCPNGCGGKFLQRGLEKHVLTKCPKRPQPTSPPPSAPLPQKPKEEPKTQKEAKVQDHLCNLLELFKQVECKYCDEEYTSTSIEEHEASCDWKPKRCQYCNMVIISRDLARHEGNCKQSNRQCSHCLQSFPSSAFSTHLPKCTKRPIKCIRCGELFAADIIVAHSTSCKPGESKGVPPPPSTSPPAHLLQAASPKRKSESDLKALLSARNIGAKEEPSDRTSRRNFALSQLTAPQEQLPDEDEDDEDEDDEDDDDMSLAQVVAEWNVENVCLWLREDVGVPDVVDRFEALQIDGQMLLELDERALVNDLGIKAKLSRDRILAAIGAIKTSDGSDGDDDDDDDETDQPLRI
ncbi:hypothetical protein Ae201684_002314 [Aphanomyces euteiches]|uniref:SAM domain-containing protein n=1 Tax=Aphanomyces euteiches TaxID=100861 RepID=A0A6G0XRH2_9STRA|nr:hypothetical protein Ae201684_002314 [Aphanomyces euteiches]